MFSAQQRPGGRGQPQPLGGPVIRAARAGRTRSCQRAEHSIRRRWLASWAAPAKAASHTKTFSPARTGSAGKVFSACSVCRQASGVAPASASAGPDLKIEELREAGVEWLVAVVQRGQDARRRGWRCGRPAAGQRPGPGNRTVRSPAAAAARCRSRSSWRWPRRGAPSRPGRRRSRPARRPGRACWRSRGSRRTGRRRPGHGTGRRPPCRPPPGSPRAPGRTTRSGHPAGRAAACTAAVPRPGSGRRSSGCLLEETILVTSAAAGQAVLRAA